jgi:hypothetical protein
VEVFRLGNKGISGDIASMKKFLTLGVTLAILAGFIFVSFAAKKTTNKNQTS